jgi:hypothetical protein
MLQQHFDHIEKVLLAQYNHSSALGHPVDKGTARELFIKEFLRTHVGENVGIGSGEIIDARSQAGEKRHQHDVVIYRKDYPKLHYADGVEVFLVESVIATIEIKSILDEEGLRQAIRAAYALKNLERNIDWIMVHGAKPVIRSYVFGFTGPAKMTTVSSWFSTIHQSLGIRPPEMGTTMSERIGVPSPALDGVILLGKGVLHVDNATLVPKGHSDNVDVKDPKARFFVNEWEKGNLQILFLWLTDAISQIHISRLNYGPYLPK